MASAAATLAPDGDPDQQAFLSRQPPRHRDGLFGVDADIDVGESRS